MKAIIQATTTGWRIIGGACKAGEWKEHIQTLKGLYQPTER